MNNLINKQIKPLLLTMTFLTGSIVGSSAIASTGLVKMYELALEHDAQLAQAEVVYQASLDSLTIAKAPLLPQITADGGYTINDSSSESADVNTLSIGVNLQQSLYEHDTWARYEQAKSVLEKAKYELQIARQNMIVRLAKRYFDVLLAKVDVELSIAQEKANKNQWDRAKVSAEIGLASKTDVLQTKSTYDLTKSERIRAENSLDVAYEGLIKLTGNAANDLKRIAFDTKIPEEALNIQEHENKASDQNLTVLKLIAQMQVASEDIEIQKSGHWFKFFLRAGYTDNSYSNFDSDYESTYKDNQNMSVGVYTSIPLYSGGRTSALVSQARANHQAAIIGVRDAKENAKLNARVEVRNIQRGFELVSANRAAVKSNEAFLETAEESYKVGLKDLLDVLTARANKYQALRNLTLSLHNLVLSKLRLAQATGSLNVDKLNEIEVLLSNP